MNKACSAKSLGLAGSLLIGCLCIAPTPARADIVFDLNAVVGNRAILPGLTTTPPQGLTVTGTLDINTTTGVLDSANITVQTDGNTFTHVLGCPLGFCIEYGSGTAIGILLEERARLELGSLIGYSGGSLGSLSRVFLANPLGDAPPTDTTEYLLSGTLTEAAVPEPGLYGALTIGLAGLLLVGWRRRRA